MPANVRYRSPRCRGVTCELAKGDEDADGITQLIITALERDRQLLPPLFQQLKRLEGPQQPEGEPKQ